VAIGLPKPFAKTEVGTSCTCMRFVDLRRDDKSYFLTGSKYPEYISSMRTHNKQYLNSNRTMIEQYC
jgi:hypothetical protein